MKAKSFRFVRLMVMLFFLLGTAIPYAYADSDGDGFDTPADCNDGDPDTYPGAPELCDGLDNDCNYRLPSNERDRDGDGYLQCADCNDYNANVNPGRTEILCNNIDDDCNPATTDCTGQDNDGDGSLTPDDCNDGDAAVYPGAPELCDGLDNNCDTVIPANETDSDSDGSRVCDGDCNDADPNTRPGAVELCDGLDNNCDTVIPANESDGDSDGFRICDGDCNDADPVLNPAGVEGPFGNATCSDGIDNNCDGQTDSADAGCADPCTDNDGDGYGNPGDSSCANGSATDCDDTNAAVNPSAVEVLCDGLDNDCNPATSDGTNCTDVDQDGFETPEDCDDFDPNTYPGAPELCDGKDNDCDYRVPSNERDRDTDGYLQCEDCNDYNANVNPGQVEICSDGIDNNCDTLIDDATCSCPDGDGDGFTLELCGGTDCDDNDANVNPVAVEIPFNGIDDDCDPTTLDNPPVDNDGDGSFSDVDCDDNDPDRYPGAFEACTDSIDNDCDNQIDLADTYDCGPPACGTATTPLSSPHLASLLNPDNTIHPDDGGLRCAKCHYTDAGGFEVPGGRYHCQRCHGAPNDLSDPLNGILKSQYPLAFPYGFGSAQNVVTHSATIVGNKYGNWDVSCVVCHNPHSQEQNIKYRSTYGKLIKRFICYDNQATSQSVVGTIQFTSDTGIGSFADGPPYNENICETCHTRTNYHQNDGSAPSGQSHNDGKKCTDCHLHSSGFAPTGGEAQAPHNTAFYTANCGFCHVEDSGGTLLLSQPIPSDECIKCHGTRKSHSSAVSGSGKYTYSTECVDCHDPMFDVGGNIKAVRQRVPQSVIAGSSIVFTSETGPGSFADGAPYNENICETCHTMTDHHRYDGSAPLHNDGTDKSGSNCAECHNHNNSWLP